MNNNQLHTHSTYSIFDSPSTPLEIVERCAEIGASSVALTDHGTLLGIEPFFDAGKEVERRTGRKINIVPGVEAYMSNGEHLLIVARNDRGYRLISKAVKEASAPENLSRKTKRMTMTNDILVKWFRGSNDVIATSACIGGPLGHILLKGRSNEMKRAAPSEQLERNREDYERYMECCVRREELNQKKAELTKERERQKKYTQTRFRKAIEEKKKILSLMDESDLNYRSVQGEIENMELMRDSAISFVETAKKMTARFRNESKSITQRKSRAEKGYRAYLKAEEELLKYPSFTDGELREIAERKARWLSGIFPNFFIEMQYHGLEEEAHVMPILADIAERLHIPLIAANDAHVTKKSEDLFEARRILRYGYFGKCETISETDRELYIKTDEEMAMMLGKILAPEKVKEALDSTAVLDECHVLHEVKEHYPKIKGGPSFDELLEERRRQMINEGIWNDSYEKRLAKETEIIRSMGYVDYHMVVRDFCNAGRIMGKIPADRIDDMPRTTDFDVIRKWEEENGYSIGTGIGLGRGSAAGSLVCYMLGITNVDPMKYDLLFERFLNPERASMPDIDTDVASFVRPYLIRYIRDTYGKDAVCSIATETTYGAKSALLMAGRERSGQLFGTSKDRKTVALRSQYANEITYPLTKIIPEGDRVLEKDGEENIEPSKRKGCRHLLETYIASPHPVTLRGIEPEREIGILWSRARLIEGKLSGTGVHAGGIVISDNRDISDHIPVAYSPKKDVWAAQCTKEKIEERGMLKMDVLGLNTLSIISDCLWLIRRHRGISIDVDSLPEDSAVFESIYCSGNTNSVFQFESPGMKDLLTRFRPSSIEDLILLNAVYRPGPMQYVDAIVEARTTGHVPESCLTKIPQLREILEPTYMCIIYQEQIMRICQKLAGYSLGQADNVRKYMSKKKEKALKDERQSFVYGDSSRNIAGCVANGIDERLANELFDQMISFGSYCFNKSHAACYSINSYITAWLKHYYPAEFFCAMFNNVKPDQHAPIIQDCTRMRIRLLPPDINHSRYEFTLEDGAIRYGFSAIKGLGKATTEAAEIIVKERAGNRFRSFRDFIGRCLTTDGKNISTLPKDLVHALVRAGCFDFAGTSRDALCLAYPKKKTLSIVKTGEEEARERMKDFGDGLPVAPMSLDAKKNIADDLEHIGLVMDTSMLRDCEGMGLCLPSQMPDGKRFSMAGILVTYQERQTRKGNRCITLAIQTTEGMINATMFGDECRRYSSRLNDMLCSPWEFSIEKHDGYMNVHSIRYLRQPRRYEATVSSKEALLVARELVKNQKPDDRYGIIIRCMCSINGEPRRVHATAARTGDEWLERLHKAGAEIRSFDITSRHENFAVHDEPETGTAETETEDDGRGR